MNGRVVRPLFEFRDRITNKITEELGVLAVGKDLAAEVLSARILMESPLEEAATLYRGVEARLLPTAWGLDVENEDDAREAARVDEPEAAARLVRRTLEDSVERAIEGKARIAVLTGGGVDSSALLSLVHDRVRRDGRTVFAVALQFGGLGDDRPYLAAMQEHLGCEVVGVQPEHGAALLDLVWNGVEAAPFVWPVGTCEVAMLRAARANGADVVLSGVGADELFDGVPSSLSSLAARGRLLEAVRAARALAGFAGTRAPVLQWIVRPRLARLQPRALRRVRVPRDGALPVPRWAGSTLRATAAQMGKTRLERTLARDARAPLERFRNASYREHLFWLRHQEQRGGGIERRDPYHDLGVARVATALAPHLLLTGDVRRGLFRRAVADLLPAFVRERVDKASFAPAFGRFYVKAAPELRDLFDVRELASLGLADASEFARDARLRLAQPDDLGQYAFAWTAVATEAFLRRRAGRA